MSDEMAADDVVMGEGAADDSALRAAMPCLRLRLVCSHGNPVDAVLSVPAAGAGLADALQLDGQALDDMQRAEADLCRIDLQARAWRLANDSHSLACFVNGGRVTAGATVPVGDGDVLEIGLLRFLVELEGVEESTAAFDLRDLALPQARDAQSPQAFADPFGALDIEGARPQPGSNPLAALLGAQPAASPPTAAAIAVEDAADDIAPIEHRPHLDRANALLGELHEGFVRAVRDPARAGENMLWDTGDALAGETTLTTLDDLTRDALAAYPLVRDMLQQPQTIDQILDDFDTLGRSPLLDPDAPEEVLRLFAPEIAQGSKAAIPSLTRREHHALSPDSPMPVDWVRRDGQAPG